jgi:hypothetical protein
MNTAAEEAEEGREKNNEKYRLRQCRKAVFSLG